jgi:hypothetical protein
LGATPPPPVPPSPNCVGAIAPNTNSSRVGPPSSRVHFLDESESSCSPRDTSASQREGLDRKLVLSYHARWTFAVEILPALRRAGVLSVLGQGTGRARIWRAWAWWRRTLARRRWTRARRVRISWLGCVRFFLTFFLS